MEATKASIFQTGIYITYFKCFPNFSFHHISTLPLSVLNMFIRLHIFYTIGDRTGDSVELAK